MSNSLALITVKQIGGSILKHFGDEVLLKLHLSAGDWVLLARVFVLNLDGDYQFATVRLVKDVNVTVDEVKKYMSAKSTLCYAMQAGVRVDQEEVVTLNAGTYDGAAQDPSLVAMRVDATKVV